MDDILQPLRRYLRSGESEEEECRGVFKYEYLPTLCYRCGRIGHARRDCSHFETLDMNMDRAGYGPWMEGVNLQFTSVIWSMTWKELWDSLDEQTMLNMLIDPSPYYNPMMTNVNASSSRRGALPRIVIRDDSRLQEAFGENRNVMEDGEDHVVPGYSKHLE